MKKATEILSVTSDLDETGQAKQIEADSENCVRESTNHSIAHSEGRLERTAPRHHKQKLHARKYRARLRKANADVDFYGADVKSLRKLRQAGRTESRARQTELRAVVKERM